MEAAARIQMTVAQVTVVTMKEISGWNWVLNSPVSNDTYTDLCVRSPAFTYPHKLVGSFK